MVAAFFFAWNLVMGIVIAVTLQILDRRRLTPEQRAWVWNAASWGSAVYNFGPLSLVAWGYVTRSPRYIVGLLVGVELAIVALVTQGVLNEIVGRVLGFRAAKLETHRFEILATMAACVAIAILVGVGRSIYEAVRARRATSKAASVELRAEQSYSRS